MKSQLKLLGRKHSKKKKDQHQNLEHKHEDNDIPFADDDIQEDSAGGLVLLIPADKNNSSLNIPESKLEKRYSDLSPTNFVSSTRYAAKNTSDYVSTMSSNTSDYVSTMSSNTSDYVSTMSSNTSDYVPSISSNNNDYVQTISSNNNDYVQTISSDTNGYVPTISSNNNDYVQTISSNNNDYVQTISSDTNGYVPTIPSNINVSTTSSTTNSNAPTSRSVTVHIHSDLHTSSVECSKHHIHEHFIPVHTLNANHFPENFRKPCWSKFIKLKAIDVVHLIVNFTSENRPDELGFKGTTTARHGTGTAYLYNMDKIEKCGCKAVQSVHFVSGLFRVFTASHVVFDDEEARNTTVEFFYDSADLSTIVKGWGVRVCHVDVKKKRSIIECRTHDVSLYQRLRDAQRKRNELLKEELQKEVGAHQMVVLISHPHGLCKQVSFGTLKEKNVTDESKITKEGVKLVDCTLTYDTPSCPGAGGGPINVIGGGTPSYAFAPHLAYKGNGENVSGVGWARVDC